MSVMYGYLDYIIYILEIVCMYLFFFICLFLVHLRVYNICVCKRLVVRVFLMYRLVLFCGVTEFTKTYWFHANPNLSLYIINWVPSLKWGSSSYVGYDRDGLSKDYPFVGRSKKKKLSICYIHTSHISHKMN